jgi:hypothetical protein
MVKIEIRRYIYINILTSQGPIGVARVPMSREEIDGKSKNSKLWKNGNNCNTRTK